MSENHFKVAIIGSGPAGLTAAIYTARANLAPVIFEGIQPGGQLTITTEVENYPGFENGVQGPELMDVMRKQALKFGATSKFNEIRDVDFSVRPFKLKTDNEEEFTADSVIISTGASAKLLGLPSEKEYMGYGVSACATCDGFFYKGLKVLVVGGGDTAMEEANYLTTFADEVIVIHRREGFRSSQIMLDRAKKNPKIKFMTNRTIKEIVGDVNAMGHKKVTGAILENTQDGSTEEIKTDGIFIAIGHQPNTKVFNNKLKMDETGYIQVKSGSTYTNIDGVFAAGDVADKTYRQAITAAGTGCMAALDAQHWLEEKELA
ncbi:MAG: thioredoxin-disulfide reductase [Ignavibacteriae bacterium]|nr:MAG: thioredoxin-disulfide reductase [Ignavibacteriota bacterium]